MKRIVPVFFALGAIASLSMLATAQQPGGRGGQGRGPGGPGGEGGPPPHPIVEAIDADRDHELSSQEIDGAAAALKKLDRNNDGKLTRDELRPAGGPGGEPGRGPDGGGPGRGPGGEGQQGRGGERAGGNGSANEFLARLMSFDKNKDGKVSKAELPSRMQGIVTRHDGNKDGALDKDELTKFAAQLAGGRDGRGRGQDDRGPEGGGNGPAGRGPDGRDPEGRGPGGGGPDPARMVEHAMEFDADKDGKLSRAELMKFAEEMVRRGPPGGGRDGQGPPPGGGRGGRPQEGRGGQGGERPARPAAE